MIRHYLHSGAISRDGGPWRERKERDYDVTQCGKILRPKARTKSEHSQPTEGTLCVECRDAI